MARRRRVSHRAASAACSPKAKKPRKAHAAASAHKGVSIVQVKHKAAKAAVGKKPKKC